jgi:hypothetical protein
MSSLPLRPARVHGVGEALILPNGSLAPGGLNPLGRQCLVDTGRPRRSTPPLGLVRLPPLPLAATHLTPKIARAGLEYPRALGGGAWGEGEEAAERGEQDAGDALPRSRIKPVRHGRKPTRVSARAPPGDGRRERFNADLPSDLTIGLKTTRLQSLEHALAGAEQLRLATPREVRTCQT